MTESVLEEGLGNTARQPLLGNPDASVRKNGRNFDEEDGQTRFSYEEAVEETGFGLFHGALLVVCGWANASDAVEILCVSFLLPTARCDLLLSSSDMGLLTASIFLGMMVGGYVWGYLADQRGRRRVLVLSLTVNGVFGALASLAPMFWLFLLLRFVSGVGVGGSIPVIFSYFSEFQARTRRGVMISALATFWMAGNILAAGLAWLVIPSTSLSFQLGSLQFQSWRLFVVLCSIPSLSSALVFGLVMPESPKFLMEAGREAEAIAVFQKMFMFNHRGDTKPFPWHSLVLQQMELPLEISGLRIVSGSHKEHVVPNTKLRRLIHTLKEGLSPIGKLFTTPLTSRSVILFVIFFSISFGYYGLWMWFPELFKRTEDGGSPCSNVSRSSSVHPENHTCYPVQTAVYMEGFVTAAANLPGNILTILLMDSVGGKVLISFSLLVSGVSVFFIWLVKTKLQSLAMSCLFSAVSVISWNALDVIGVELYPTQLRSSALGFFTGVGRVAAILGNLVFGQLLDTSCAIPILLVAALLFSGGLSAILLPRTLQTELT
ncbi:synaptic vesicle glycoprotein 2C isoform X1 [Lepisosteus oculatus]|uniref:synaptic vesicle glycoprotein 2C isoform X1 n=1 Tax=Lepisosteus oculatus TaxID=7918 RepID=UPI0037212C97